MEASNSKFTLFCNEKKVALEVKWGFVALGMELGGGGILHIGV